MKSYFDGKMETDEDKQALEEVKKYYLHYQCFIMNKRVYNDAPWWIKQKSVVARLSGHCTSISLRTENLCSVQVSREERFCGYHQLQHDFLCL